MMFEELIEIFLSNLRARVRNGEMTERRLARLIGVSQPHMHNVLKGVRTLTPQVSDRILMELKMSVLDLLDSYWQRPQREVVREISSQYSEVRILDGRLGPEYPWPTKVGGAGRFRVTAPALEKTMAPVVARLGADPAMAPIFGADDWALLDQSVRARSAIDPEALYAVRWGRFGLLRRLKLDGDLLWLISQEDQHHPERWIDVSVAGGDVMQIVKARAVLLRPEFEWPG